MLGSVGTCAYDLHFNLVGECCCLHGYMWSLVCFRTQLMSKDFGELGLGLIS